MPASPVIAVVDYGAGNLRSVAKALERSGLEPKVTSVPAAIRRADGVVLPGVGAFADSMTRLRDKRLDGAVRDSIEAGRPYLGLCLGLQLLFEESDEHGRTAGLGILPGRVERFPDRDPAGGILRVPHIGWNTVRFCGDHPMLEQLPSEACFYFVHSYRVRLGRRSLASGWTDYGGEFAAAAAHENMFAVQFHPEKSQGAGRQLLDAYAGWVSACR